MLIKLKTEHKITYPERPLLDPTCTETERKCSKMVTDVTRRWDDQWLFSSLILCVLLFSSLCMYYFYNQENKIFFLKKQF